MGNARGGRSDAVRYRAPAFRPPFADLHLFALLGLPYSFLIGTGSGFFSLMPYLGLPLALLPVIPACPRHRRASATLLFAAVAHLLGLNVPYPKLVGARVQLNPLVVTFSLMFWGFLWDARRADPRHSDYGQPESGLRQRPWFLGD